MDPDQLALFPDDICAAKHGGNAHSDAAFALTKRARDAARIYAWVDQRGKRGAITDEAVRALGICAQTASARFSELKASGYFVPSGAKRKTVRGMTAGVFVTVGVARRLKMPVPEQLRLALEGDGHG
jgi:hypothetical protein